MRKENNQNNNLMKSNSSFTYEENKYKLGTKVTFQDLLLLKEIYKDCNLLYSDISLNTIILMSINNRFIPRKTLSSAICECEKPIFEFYCKYKRENITFNKDLKNIINCQKYQEETTGHFDILYFLGIDYTKTNNEFNNKSYITAHPRFQLIFSTSLGYITEGFINGGLCENDIEILKKYNEEVGMLYETIYPFILQMRPYCERYLGFPNDYLSKTLQIIRNLSLAYLLNVNEYKNPQIVRNILEKIRDNEIEINEEFFDIKYKISIVEAKKILDNEKEIMENNNKVYKLTKNS